MIKHLYVHVPFCKSICYYCDFCHRVYDKDLVNKWLDTLQKEIDNECEGQYETIYIGGGTPNSLSNDELDRLLSLIKPYSNEVEEYTIEINPEFFNLEQLNIIKKYGINRFSIGVQSSDNNMLKSLNRKHTFEDVKNTISLLKENGLNNISVDLMYSLPNQTMKDLENTLNDVLSLDVPHISIYSLTIEENSVFGKKGISKLDDDLEADMYEFIIKKLTNNGYINYEVSNFAKDGFESKHNLGYWNYDDYLGVSMSSTSKIGNHRYTTTSNFESYFNSYKNKDEDLTLSKKDLIIENMIMSLRTNTGLSLNKFKTEYGLDFKTIFIHELDKYNDNLLIKNDYLYVKNKAILNTILTDFLIDLDSISFYN